jgi:hypothetical protein
MVCVRLEEESDSWFLLCHQLTDPGLIVAGAALHGEIDAYVRLQCPDVLQVLQEEVEGSECGRDVGHPALDRPSVTLFDLAEDVSGKSVPGVHLLPGHVEHLGFDMTPPWNYNFSKSRLRLK